MTIADLFSQNSQLVEIALLLAGSGGIIGIIRALILIPSDRSSSAVAQAQGAMEAMAELNDALKSELRFCREEIERLAEGNRSKDEMVRHLQGLIAGWDIFDDDESFPPSGERK